MSGIEFEEAYEYCRAKLASCKVATLATCGSDMKVSSRSMSLVFISGALWFQTDECFRKARQIAENPNVALSFENIQVEGFAELVGGADDPDCAMFVERFKDTHPGSFASYTHLAEERIYRIRINRLMAWRYSEGRAFIDTLDLVKRKAERQFYPDSFHR